MANGRTVKIRRAAISVNVTASCLIAGAIFLMVNYLGYRHYRRFDWTASSYFSLSDKTIGVLKGLGEAGGGHPSSTPVQSRATTYASSSRATQR